MLELEYLWFDSPILKLLFSQRTPLVLLYNNDGNRPHFLDAELDPIEGESMQGSQFIDLEEGEALQEDRLITTFLGCIRRRKREIHMSKPADYD